MNSKKIAYAILFIGLICLAPMALAKVTVSDPLGGVTFDELLLKIIGEVGTIIASLGVIMIIVAGIFYLTSAGSPERIGVAKKALIYAIVGIAIGLAAKGIVESIKKIIGA